MPTLSIPGGPKVRWDARRRSRVEITHRVTLSGHSFRVTLNLPRECFEEGAKAIDAMQALASALVERLPKRHTRRGVLRAVCRPLGSRSRASIEIERSAIPTLREGLAQLGTDPKEALGYNLFAGCCTSFVATLVRTPPRRGGLPVRQVTLALPAALTAVRALVAARQKDERLRARIEEIAEKDAELNAYLQVVDEFGWNLDQALVVGIVDRALRGAWEKAGHPGIIYTGAPELALYKEMGQVPHPAVRYRDPADTLREYLYGQHTKPIVDSLLKVTRKSPALVKSYLEWAERTYLGEPGDAAKAFHLL